MLKPWQEFELSTTEERVFKPHFITETSLKMSVLQTVRVANCRLIDHTMNQSTDLSDSSVNAVIKLYSSATRCNKNVYVNDFVHS